AVPSEAAPLGSAADVLRPGFAAPPNVQQVNHRWNHHCTWRRSYRRSVRVCWWSPRRYYGPSFYFRFGPDRHYHHRHYRRYHWR
ncbi:MAG TPA: hypothetical protein VNK52_12925, partial [Hyphomicrobiaceae bacterium]|nr:hypothetical protein [Hyphomicrobiaceae bacterium]